MAAFPALKPLTAGYQGQSLKRMSFGFDNALASLIWIQLLQKASHDSLESNEVSWEFAQLDSITTLDPKFESGFEFGAPFLSVFRRDKLGAEILLKKWHRKRPTYWKTSYLLGYHLYYEMGRHTEASQYILRAAELEKAPAWLSSLGVRLLEETFATEQAFRLVLELYHHAVSPIAQERLQARLRSLNLTLQLKKWNEALEKYTSVHRKFPTSFSQLQPYFQWKVSALREIASVQNSERIREIILERFPFMIDPKTKSVLCMKSREELGIENSGVHLTPEQKGKAHGTSQ